MKSKKEAEDILRRIELYNKAVVGTVSLQKSIYKRMKENISNARSLQEESLPHAAQQKIKKYQEKYGQFERLGFIFGHFKPCKQKFQLSSYDTE